MHIYWNTTTLMIYITQSWEARLASSRVADFSSDPRLGAYQRMLPALPDKPVQSTQADEQGQQQSQQQQSTASTSGNAEASTSTPKKEEEGSNASTVLKQENGKVGRYF